MKEALAETGRNSRGDKTAFVKHVKVDLSGGSDKRLLKSVLGLENHGIGTRNGSMPTTEGRGMASWWDKSLVFGERKLPLPPPLEVSYWETER